MRLIVFRHGIAIDREDPACPPDPERPLTAKGKKRTREAALGLRALGVTVDIVISSPLVRAVETAYIAMDVLGVPEDGLLHSEALLPASDPASFLKLLGGRPRQDVLCTGHAPHLDRLVAAAVGFPGHEITRLRKAGAAEIEIAEPGRAPGTLVWVATSRVLRHLGACNPA